MARGKGARVVQQSMPGLAGFDKKAMTDIMGQFLGKKESIDQGLAASKFKTLLSAVERIVNFVGSFDRSIINKALRQRAIATGSSLEEDEQLAESKHFKNWVVDANTFIGDCKPRMDGGGVEMVEAYLSAKNHKVVSDCVHLCSKLSKYKKFIQSNEDMSDAFLKSSKTKDLVLFPFSRLDIKFIYVYCDIDASAKKYIMLFLNMVYNTAHDIFQVIINPDIDIDKISSIVMATIAQTKKMIPRTEKAFRKIEESMSMFKDNFGDYYRDFIEAKDPSIILTNFLSDCKNTHTTSDNKSDIELARQFTRIAGFFKKQLNGKIKDPQIAAVLDAIDENFKALNIDAGDINTDDENSMDDDDDEHSVNCDGSIFAD
jgi:hypothetical protein